MTRSRTTTMLLFAVVLLVALSAWLLGNGSAVTPASAATETPSAGRAREGILVSATGEVLGVATRYAPTSPSEPLRPPSTMP